MEVTGFTDGEGGLFGNEDTTFVNHTETINGETRDTSSEVDDWQTLLFVIVFLTLIGAFWEEGNVDFSEPEPEEDVTDVSGSDGLPVFATNNESFYEEFVSDSEFVGSTTERTNVGGNITEASASVDLDTAANTFSLDFSIYWYMAGEIDGATSTFEMDSSMTVNIDYGRSLITKLALTISYKITLGSASSEFKLSETIEEGNIDVNTDGGGLSLPINPIFILSGLTTMVLINRKFRK